MKKIVLWFFTTICALICITCQKWPIMTKLVPQTPRLEKLQGLKRETRIISGLALVSARDHSRLWVGQGVSTKQVTRIRQKHDLYFHIVT